MKLRICFLFFLVLQVTVKTYAINPSREYVITPDSLKIPFEKLTIKTTDGALLHSWTFIQKTPGKPFIIISYGDAGNMGGVLFQARALYNAGYNVITYDYRGFGKSSDFEMNKDQIYYDEFKTDLTAVLQTVKKNYQPSQVYLMGLSMGSIISFMVSQAQVVDGLIMDSFVINPIHIKERIEALKHKQLILPKSVNSYVESVRKSQVRVLIFQGEADPFTTFNDAKEYVSNNRKAKLVTWNCSHLQSFYKMTKDVLGDLYVNQISTFISN
jgi:uncharacterized protein